MQELIEQLAATPKALAHLVAEATEGRLKAAAEGEWSARVILAHFRDDEYLCMRVALERMLAEPNPELTNIDGGEWEPGRNRTRDRKEWLLADFALQRQASISILRGLRPEDWQRSGRFSGHTITIEQFLGAWVHHDREHIAQLERVMGETLVTVLERRARLVDEQS